MDNAQESEDCRRASAQLLDLDDIPASDTGVVAMGDDAALGELPKDLRPHAAKLSFESTVSRRLVHRDFIDHVLLTDILRLEEGRFLCGARIPQSHGYFNEGGGPHVYSGILLSAEMGRQAGIAISHQFLGVSTSLCHILRELSCTLEWPGLSLVTSPRMANVVMEVRLRDCSYRRTRELMGLVMECISYQAGERIQHAAGEWIFVPRKIYEKLRKPAPEALESSSSPQRLERVEPSVVGRRRLENIVISSPCESAEGIVEADLIVDPDHPYFFEHALDHVSGMLLLEGCHQIGTALAGSRCGWAPREIVCREFGARFHQFAELETPVKLEARLQTASRAPGASNALALSIQAKQEGRLLAELSLEMATAAAFEPAAGVDEVRVAAGGRR
ncbi:MAG TPA: AfsA-related hotdog domain-containing protein [Thermoanaerobaculia bacterium]|nr:AfsA-related hotdog domain-containing protein [Thermoanaerobaculia bacterium]